MEYYVDNSVTRSGDGSPEHPFKTIQAAAEIAVAGDMVFVAPGIYREYVNPKSSGTADHRITYQSVEAGKAIITGAEVAAIWKRIDGNVWFMSVSNDIFDSYNPYTTLVKGDWFEEAYVAHIGDVFLNHKSMYEVTDLEKVYHPVRSFTSWDGDFSVYTWYTRQNKEENTTEFFANFGEFDPTQEEVEIAVRKNCFLPKEEGIGYITLSGFTVREAATQWAPPTAYQDGMIGPHWSKGWIIEDCEVYESKCSGISLGKYLQPQNENKWTTWKLKNGTQTEREAICQASYEGWNKEHIGGHIVRRCNIHHCGQTGIVGHLGGVFSRIEDNHIHHINNKQNLAGAEIGGIKMHAAIDVIIRRNHIHNCTRGIWLDWQAQGTRVTQNLFHDNCLSFPFETREWEEMLPIVGTLGEDIFVEVSHGPTLIDNNILLSDRALKLCAQGIAVVHNLIAGSLAAIGLGANNGSSALPSPRYTPYHVVHGTRVAGFMTILHGDTRIYNNIFVQKKDIHPFKWVMQQFAEDNKETIDFDDGNFKVGTFPYNHYPDYAAWEDMIVNYQPGGIFGGGSDRYYSYLPVWSKGNQYFNGAVPMDCETDAHVDTEHEIEINLKQTDEGWKLETNLYDFVKEHTCSCISTETLGMAFEPEQKFENPDGSPIIFNIDYFDQHRGLYPTSGPVENGEKIKEVNKLC